MALTTVPVTATTSTATPDKMIKAGVTAQATIYTCPAGRKFIGQAVVGAQSSSSIYMGSGTNSSIQGSTSGGHSWDIYLSAGESILGQYSGISGIESDA